MSRFEVSSVTRHADDDDPDLEGDPVIIETTEAIEIPLPDVVEGNGGTATLRVDTFKENNGAERIPLCNKSDISLALYEDEYKTHGQKISQMLRSLSLYNTVPQGDETESNGAGRAAKEPAKLGTLSGVFFPCTQNIFGVLFFIRLAWIVGVAGIVESLGVVLLCCAVTFLTSISLSAIATNGVVSAGGPYYMISRNLGPELGGAIGILFYFGNTIAAAMYLTGGVEIFLVYIYPQAKLFDSMYNNFRVFGTVLLLGVALVVLAGVRVVGKFAIPALVVVLSCIACTFIGMFWRFNGDNNLMYCMVGNRPVNLVGFNERFGYVPNCTADGLTRVFCSNSTSAQDCDAYFAEILDKNPAAIRSERAITGFSSDAWKENLWSKYRAAGDVLTKGDIDEEPEAPKNSFWVFEDTTTSFIILIGVYFPSVTGIMAGSNRSGNLRDVSRSIPMGTLGAQLTTSVAYILGTLFFGMTISEMFIRDKYGQSAMGKMIVAEMAIPIPIIILIGCLMSTIGAGMQSMTGAPRILQAVAKDEVIPFLRVFQYQDSRGEPLYAILMTWLICQIGILIAVIENLTALITQFLVMCYFGINVSCALQSIMKAPGWRPSFKYYHWSLSLTGAILCQLVMFVSAWHFAIVAICIGAAVYKYIEYAGAEKEWGDGLKGLKLSAARYALLSVDTRHEQHSRNWRPQLLVLYPTAPQFSRNQLSEKQEKLLSFVGQLKAGKGLTLIAECLEGSYTEKAAEVVTERERLAEQLRRHRIRGFCDVVVADHFTNGVSYLIQTSGLGGLRHNSVVVVWPDNWATSDAEAKWFVGVLRSIVAAKCAVLVPKRICAFPQSNERVTGTVDVWWIVHDGGLLMLLPFLLQKHKTWKGTRLRLFTVAHFDENSTQMKEDLEKFLYHLRIDGEVFVIDMPDSDISEYTYERTMKMEERMRFLKEIKDRRQTDAPATVDEVVLERRFSRIERKQSTISQNSITHPPTPENMAASLSRVRFSENSVEIRRPTIEEEPNRLQSGDRPESFNVRKMHTAVKLNELMKERSGGAQLIVLNLPGPPDVSEDDAYYLEFIEALTEGLDRVFLVRGTGTEVVTIYS